MSTCTLLQKFSTWASPHFATSVQHSLTVSSSPDEVCQEVEEAAHKGVGLASDDGPSHLQRLSNCSKHIPTSI